MAKLFGITGGIGSGKSTIACRLRGLGYEVFLTDVEAKAIMEHNPCVRSQIELLFGSDIYTADSLNSKAVAQIVFSDPQMLHKLNQIVHPAVCYEVAQWAKNMGGDFCFVESAILYESGLDKICSGVIGIVAPKNLCLERAAKRDSATKEQILGRMNQQKTPEQIAALADYVVNNDGVASIEDLCLQIQKFCRTFVGLQ